uniref:hypothetical protein n=1 Tax=Roseovarius indicus TaxID=540747 RepID=UPI003B51BB07
MAGLALATCLALAACYPERPSESASPTPPEAAPNPDAVVLSARQVSGSAEGATSGCRVRFPITYPADVPPHRRQIRVYPMDAPTSVANTIYDDAWRFPISPNRPYLRSNPDGTITWRGFGKRFAPCQHTSWVVEIGECVSGECPPATFYPSRDMGDISVELRR